MLVPFTPLPLIFCILLSQILILCLFKTAEDFTITALWSRHLFIITHIFILSGALHFLLHLCASLWDHFLLPPKIIPFRFPLLWVLWWPLSVPICWKYFYCAFISLYHPTDFIYKIVYLMCFYCDVNKWFFHFFGLHSIEYFMVIGFQNIVRSEF